VSQQPKSRDMFPVLHTRGGEIRYVRQRFLSYSLDDRRRWVAWLNTAYHGENEIRSRPVARARWRWLLHLRTHRLCATLRRDWS
jgi:hypothetical protein